jgi:uncharacterized protein YjbI with pentapeptide repeats
MPKELDPFDVEALERSLNDSATRVSAIWVSFLIFSLYLLIAGSTVEHRQLLLAEPVKLPVLNVDLPLWGFFFLAPILFVILHVYVLLQVLLLARTAAAYNDAIERAKLPRQVESSLRQRLANTLFAQIFAGTPREREGWLGWLLKAMAWITLAIAPILTVLAFQFSFLPYHSHVATWTHRFLILVELAAAFVLWPLVLDARRDLKWIGIWAWIKRTDALPIRLFGPKDRRNDELIWLRQQAFPISGGMLFILISLCFSSFPGEPHVNLLTFHAWSSVQCERWIQRKFAFMDLRFDRLVVPRVDVVDREKLSKIEEATKRAGEEPYQGERTRILRDRDLNCGDFSDYADLRRVDLTGSHLRKADLRSAKLGGASLADAELQDADLSFAQLQSAFLDSAQLQRASLFDAGLQGAYLAGAQLQGADLGGAQLQQADLRYAQLQGAYLSDHKLPEGGAQLQDALLGNAELQGASLDRAQLQGAYLEGAELQGAELRTAVITYTFFFGRACLAC